jgi:hypothetical protein
MNHTATRTRRIGAWLAAVFALAVVVTATATAQTAATPRNTAKPTISGQTREGSTLTAANGTWENSPTTYDYQWQRCSAAGAACANITGATKQTYTLTGTDVDHTMRVLVTATNSDGSASATSDPTTVVSGSDAPRNTAKPTISGTAAVGNELTATTGTWSGGATSYSFQWQRCAATTLTCANIVGAVGRAYGVRTADVGERLRVRVTARNSSSSASIESDPTTVVTATPGSTTVVTTTVAGNKAPTLTFLSLRRVGIRVYARFRVCDDRPGRITVIERDNKARALAFQRKFSVTVTSCGTFSRSWVPAARFRTPGRYVVTLRAQDTSGRLSLLRSRSLVR